jgi:hypothetical protein
MSRTLRKDTQNNMCLIFGCIQRFHILIWQMSRRILHTQYAGKFLSLFLTNTDKKTQTPFHKNIS